VIFLWGIAGLSGYRSVLGVGVGMGIGYRSVTD